MSLNAGYQADPYNTKLRSSPICPHCGHRETDAWEWDFGPCMDGEITHSCGSCGEEFVCEREVTVYYSTRKEM